MFEVISPVTAITDQAESWTIDDDASRDTGAKARLREASRRNHPEQPDRLVTSFDEMDSGYGTEQMVEEASQAAFQVIILGGGGGPGESDTTGLLVRSTATEWSKGSVMAVDAGVHLSAIDEIFKRHLPDSVKVTPPTKRASRLSRKLSLPMQGESPSKPRFYPPVTEARGASRAPSPVDGSPAKQMNVMTSGPFNSLMVPYETSAAIAAYFLRNLVSTVLITHPHLDHLSGFAINTAALQNTTKPKKVVGLPSTIEAIKTHIFNDIIWPNMSDEEGGIGFVSYQRLSEGGHSLLGENDAAGYIEVCDNLAVKAYLVSHGNCVKRHKHRGSTSMEPASPTDLRRRSSRFGSISGMSATPLPHGDHHHPPSRWAGSDLQSNGSGGWGAPQRCIVDSSAFFVRDDETSQEVLIFGDVEPDRVSMEPRNHIVWAEAAPKVARQSLTAILIECSYDDSQADPVLFGHLAPRHLVAELAMLAAKVTAYRAGILNYSEAQPKDPQECPNGFLATVTTTPSTIKRRGSLPVPHSSSKKRAHESPARSGSVPREPPESLASSRHNHHHHPGANVSVTPATPSPSKKRSMTARPLPERHASGISPMSSPTSTEPPVSMSDATQQQQATTMTTNHNNDKDGGFLETGSHQFASELVTDVEVGMPDGQGRPLAGVRVVVIHVKDPLRDHWDPREVILRQLQEHEREWRLGCEFVMCRRGDSIWV